MKKMFVMGSYGCGNRGDDAILQSICALFPDWDITAANGTYEDISKHLPVRGISCRLNEGFSLSVLGSMIKDSFRILAAIAKSDLLMFGGGSLIHDLTPYNLPFLYFWQCWAKLLGKKVCYFSMGVGPLKTSFGRSLSKFFLKRADSVYVRDYRGYGLCEELNITNAVLTADAAFAVKTKNQAQGRTLEELGLKEKEYFCVTGSQWFKSSNFWNRANMDFSKETEKFASQIRAVSQELKLKPVFVPTVMHDEVLAQNLKAYLEDLDFMIAPSDWNCKQMAEIVENSKMLLGVRMHSIIFAARQGVPFIALIYDEKVQQLLKYLGMEELALPLEKADEKTVLEHLKILQENEREISDKLKSITGQLEEKVVKSAKKVSELS